MPANILKKLFTATTTKATSITLGVLGGAMFLGIVTAPARAAILSVSSGGQIIAAPSSVQDSSPGASSAEFMLGFDEKQNVLLTENLEVDSGFIAAGTVVSSHMIFLNQPDSQTGAISKNNINWLFDGTILGVMSDRDSQLEADSNSILGASGTTYPGSFFARGLEADDSYSGVGTNQLTVSLTVSQPGDWIRVVTAKSVPEPTSVLGVLGFGALSAGSFLKSKKQQKATAKA